MELTNRLNPFFNSTNLCALTLEYLKLLSFSYFYSFFLGRLYFLFEYLYLTYINVWNKYDTSVENKDTKTKKQPKEATFGLQLTVAMGFCKK